LASSDEEIRTLARLGLTFCEARVYLTLARSGLATVKTISNLSNIAREEIYRIMPKLQKLSLVETTISHPTTFKPIPMKDAISSLMNQKLKEIRELRRETRKLVHKFRENTERPEPDFEENKFVLIPEKEALLSKLKNTVATTQETIDIICPQQAFPQGVIILGEDLEKAMNRGVKVRLIVEKPENLDCWPEIVQELKKNPSFTLRTITNHPKARLGIYDKKEVFIASNPTTYAMMSPALWSNNPSLLAIIHDNFEIMWRTAIED
jgi:sugar-specific transcriptional regulator TrmB